MTQTITSACLLLTLAVISPQQALFAEEPLQGQSQTPVDKYMRNVTRLTVEGDNGEAYFSADGKQLIYQSNRGGYACDKIWTMKIDGSDKRRVSPDHGSHTCAFFYPGSQAIVFASTSQLQGACPPKPEIPEEIGYAWPLYPYDIYRANADGSGLQKLTDNPEYDAEPVISTDGEKIVFGSQRDNDFDIYIMDADGANVTRLTDSEGYDGGPWFSPDGSRIVWRAWHPQTPEERAQWRTNMQDNYIESTPLDLWVMDADGSNKRRLTNNGATNWAPSWHPDGKRIIFSSNMDDWHEEIQRFGHNFELYMIDSDGSALERITFNDGFDSFPMFSADGKKLVFGANRNPQKPRATDIFIADWEEGIAAAENTVHHALTVKLNPAHHRIHAQDKITFAADSPRQTSFSLHRGMNPRSLTKGAVIESLDANRGSLEQRYELQLAEGLDTFTIEYGGVIHHPLEAYGKEQARGFRNTHGLIGPEGVYLAGGTSWYPQFGVDERLGFKLDITLPTGWSSVSQGRRTRHERGEESANDTWLSKTPQEEIYLIAAPFSEYSRNSGETTARVFLRQPDEKLANDYLDATVRYLGMYQQLLGPYPYSKFALVENFWETGFGMPSFTLLGSKVIRLPFILNSSYPHEILHNWWGNGVYVDYTGGNWSEGLTAYLADHLIKQQQGRGADYRQQSLQKYTDYAAAQRDFPLREFRGRHSSASEAVGYGKTMMLFHMLRRQLGDEVFIAGLQQFYRKWRFQKASFDDLRTSFEQVSGKSLGSFFDQWVNRSGAPALELDGSKIQKTGKGYRLAFRLSQTQPGKAYMLQIPLAVTLEGGKQAYQTIVEMTHRQQQFEILLSDRPLRIDIDPEFDLFRKLALEETPPAFTQLFGSSKLLVVLPRAATPAMKKAWRRFADDLGKMGPESVTVKWDDELQTLPEDRAIVVLGWENRHIETMTTALSVNGAQFKADSLTIAKRSIPREHHAVALVTRHSSGKQQPRAFIAADLPESLPGLGRKLPHYHKYSYLAFSGGEPENRLKGRWPIERSPLTTMFSESAERGQLANREALINPPAIFDAESMMETIRLLAGDALQGRGFGEPGLEQAAEIIARAFREAGLQPAGDLPGSYFQSWEEPGGEPERNSLLKNVIAVIPAADPKRRNESIVIGAHYDHLGLGWPDVRDGNLGKIHPGADDNASGVAVLLELARVLGKDFKPERNIVLVAFSGEEAGRRGSKHYVERFKANPADKIIGMINLDTVGRLGSNKLLVLGANSASEWPHIFRGIGYVSGIPIAMAAEELDSSDQVSFHEAGIPAVQLFSGVNLDYHRPTDTAEKIDSEGLVKIATVTKEAVEYLAGREEPLSVTLPGSESAAPKSGKQRKVSLGTVPDFGYQGEGYRLDGVVPGSPAAAAGLMKGDIIIQLNATAVHGLRDLSTLLKVMLPGQEISLTYRRQGDVMTTQVTLGAR